jgi:phosphoglycolate phosphatase
MAEYEASGSARTGDALRGIELVIFDKDGTLIDFHAMWGGWVNDLATGLERETGHDLAEPLSAVLGVEPGTARIRPHGLLAATPMSRIREVVVDLVAGEVGDATVAEAAVAAAWHPPDPVRLARPFGDLSALLTALRATGRRIAIATSDDREPTRRTLEALHIEGLIDGLVCADDGLRVKPAPDAVRHLCQTIGVPPARTAVVGDSITDLAMGRAAGAGRVIGVLTGVGDRARLEPLADLVLGSIEELAVR